MYPRPSPLSIPLEGGSSPASSKRKYISVILHMTTTVTHGCRCQSSCTPIFPYPLHSSDL